MTNKKRPGRKNRVFVPPCQSNSSLSTLSLTLQQIRLVSGLLQCPSPDLQAGEVLTFLLSWHVYGCGRFIRSSIRVLSGPCASMHCLTVAKTPVSRRSRAARCGSARMGWIGSNAMAWRINELRTPPLSRFSLFHVETRTLTETEKHTLRSETTVKIWWSPIKISRRGLVLTCSTDRVVRGCFARPELHSQSYTWTKT